MTIEKVILNILYRENRPMKTGELERLTGFDRNEIQKALNDMYLDGLVDFPDRCFNKVVLKKEEDNGR